MVQHLLGHPWAELVHSACYLRNLVAPTGGDTTRSQAWHGKPDYSHRRAIGCTANVHNPKESRMRSEKLEVRAEMGILVGYRHPHGDQVRGAGTECYRMLMPNGKVLTCCNVMFNEDIVQIRLI